MLALQGGEAIAEVAEDDWSRGHGVEALLQKETARSQKTHKEGDP